MRESWWLLLLLMFPNEATTLEQRTPFLFCGHVCTAMPVLMGTKTAGRCQRDYDSLSIETGDEPCARS